MDDSTSSERLTPEEKYIRKLRKKLRQIERLELLDRELSEEELFKVNSKNDIRKELHSLLKDIDPEEYDIMKRQGVNLEDSGVVNKKAKNIDAEAEDNLDADSGLSSLNKSGEKSNEKNLKKESKSACSPDDSTKEKSSPLVKESGDNLKKDKAKKDRVLNDDAFTSPSGREDAGGDTREKVKEEKSLWKDIAYQSSLLEGHNDIILSVDCTDEFIVSASRDTTVKVWHVNEVTEERSLRGHTAAVTAVAFLPVNLATAVLKKFENDPEFCYQISADCCVLAVSGSLDCTIRVWDISSGESFGSIYTYNGITALQCVEWGVVTGTEGGKLEIWCITSGQRLAFVNAFQYQVTALYIEGNQIYAGSAEGDVGIWKYDNPTKSLSSVFIMEPESHSYVPLHRLAAVVGVKGIMYFGDSGPNIKVLDWKKGDVTRLLNHTGDIGMTDSLAVSPDGYLLSSSYFIDTGCSSINVRELATGKYICSLIDRDEGRFLAMSCAPDIIVTGGHLLKVWVRKEKGDVPKKGKNLTNQNIYPTCLRKLKGKAVESASEDDTEWASSSDEEDMRESFDFGDVSGDDSERPSGWWCNIL